MKTMCAYLFLFLSASVYADGRSLEFCDLLSDVGGKTVKARQAGYSLNEILANASNVLADSPEKLTYVVNTITAVYGDRTLTSYDRGYNAVFQACMN